MRSTPARASRTLTSIMPPRRDRTRPLKLLLLLAAMGYLGFFVFGLVMGVFSAVEAVALSVVALAAITGIGLVMLRERLRPDDDPSFEDAARRTRSYRERRGF